MAAGSGLSSAVRRLLETGAEANACHDHFRSALHAAASGDDSTTAEVLLQNRVKGEERKELIQYYASSGGIKKCLESGSGIFGGGKLATKELGWSYCLKNKGETTAVHWGQLRLRDTRT